MAATAPKSVLETILEWSQDRPAWQRDGLRRIILKGRLDDADITELVDLCKVGRGDTGIALKPLPFDKTHLPANPGKADAVSLVSISEVKAVNNLAPEQMLAFESTGVTIVYGDNGAGKSGYARILKRACRARQPGKIERNIYDAGPPAAASATICYGIGGTVQPPEKWKDADRPHAILSAVSVFDSECATIHLNEKNEVAFRPFGLDIPDELAGACQKVKDALTTEKAKLETSRNPIFARPSWKAHTAAGKAIASLKHSTDIEKLKLLGTLSLDESARLARLREDMSKSPAQVVAEQKLKAGRVKSLHELVSGIAKRTSDEALAACFAADRDARLKREAALLAARTAFSGEALEGVGGNVWRALWEAARRYSTEAAYPGETFPHTAEDALCVLCQQPLDASARERFARFEEFIRKDTEQHAQAAEVAARKLKDAVASIDLRTALFKANIQEVGLYDPALARATRRFLAGARMRRYSAMKSIASGEVAALPASAPNPVTDLEAAEKKILQYVAEVLRAASGEESKKLQGEYEELSDRDLLGGMIATVTEEIERHKGIAFLEGCLADTVTNKITNLGNDIADTVITPKLRDRFQQEIVKLAADKVRVEIVRSGGKYGAPQYQIRLFAKPDAKVKDILSEGERTCVALAAFLTEVATAAHQSAFVFDDPVSSLDHRWRTQVAKRLVEESDQRQVVVFTHDLVFVNDLYDMATAAKRPVKLLTVARGPAGAGVVAEGLPWKGQSVEHRIDKMEKDARAAKKLHDNNDDDAYANAAVDVYDELRASWERGLEEVAFFRVVQRHRDYIDAKDLKKVAVLTDADCDAYQAGFKKCSGIVEAHDPSRGRNASAPPPNEILQDIQALKDWVTGLRDRQKTVA